MAEIKAYNVWANDAEYSTIVFAENRTQAKLIAMGCDCCEDAQYIDIRAKRFAPADKLYKGAAEIDWYDPDTRLALVRDFAWSCYETSWECDTCNAKQFCRLNKESCICD